MSRTIAILAAVATLTLYTSPTSAANLPSNCTKVQGTITCETEDPVGNSENSGGNSQTRETTTTSQGNLSNKRNSCSSGPGNQSTC